LAGGGAVLLDVAGTAIVNGIISVQGTGGYRTAGSAGGSILLKAAAVSGTGILDASGGTSSGNSGAGGGGRIAVILSGASHESLAEGPHADPQRSVPPRLGHHEPGGVRWRKNCLAGARRRGRHLLRRTRSAQKNGLDNRAAAMPSRRPSPSAP
jgi:hypothetical protein